MSSERRLSRSEIVLVEDISVAFAVLSLCGSLFIITCYARFRELRTFAFMLVAILSATDAANLIFDLISPQPQDLEAMEAHEIAVTPQCYVQAVGNSAFQLSSVLWTSAIAMTLYLSVVQRMRPEQTEAFFPWFLVVCWGVPLVLAVLPFINSAYGAAGGWCWIVEEQIVWRFIQLYGPLWIAVAFNAFVYVSVVRLLRRTIASAGGEDETARLIRQLLRRLNIYPFVLVVCWFWPTVNRIYESLTGGNQLLWLYIIARISSSSQGALNALAYGMTPGVREALHGSDSTSAPCCGSRRAAGGASGGARGGGGRGEVASPSFGGGGLGLHRPWSAGQGSGGYGVGNTVAAAHASPPPGIPARLLAFGESTDELDDAGAIAMTVLSRAQVGAAPVVVANPLATAGATGGLQ